MVSIYSQIAPGFAQGLGLASAMRQQRRENALRQLMQTEGPGLVSGDLRSINALARFDPRLAAQYDDRAAQKRAAAQKSQMQRMGMIASLAVGADTPEKWTKAQEFAVMSGVPREEVARYSFDMRPSLVASVRDAEAQITDREQLRAYRLARAEHDLKFQKYASQAMGAAAGMDRLNRAVMMAESGGRDVRGPMVTAGANAGDRAVGPMQVMPKTMADPGYGVQPFDPQAPDPVAEGVRVGQDYLGAMVREFGGDIEAAAIAYNAGPANAQKWLAAGRDYGVLPQPDVTRDYVGNVMRFYGAPPAAADKTSVERERWNLLTDEQRQEAAQINAGILPRAQSGETKPPTGYRETAEGNLAFIPGGPADPQQVDALRADSDGVPQGYRRAGENGLEFIPGGPADPALRAAQRGKGRVVFGPEGQLILAEGDVDEDVLALGRSARTEAEKDILAGIDTIGMIGRVQELLTNPSGVDPSIAFSDVQDIKNKFARFWGRNVGELSDVTTQELEYVGRLKSNIDQLFNAYRKEITGAAAPMAELEQLRESLFSTNLEYSEFLAKFDEFERKARRSVLIKKRALSSGLNEAEALARVNDAVKRGVTLEGLADQRYREILRDNPGWTAVQAFEQLEREGY